jgi:hypothetical protein
MKVYKKEKLKVYVFRVEECVFVYIYTSSNGCTVCGSKPGKGRRFSLLQNCPDWF